MPPPEVVVEDEIILRTEKVKSENETQIEKQADNIQIDESLSLRIPSVESK